MTENAYMQTSMNAIGRNQTFHYAKRFFTQCTWLLAVWMLAGIAHAQQTTGSIAGTVKDQTGAVVNKGAVKAVNVDTGFTRSAPTNGYGEYRIDYLPVGKYSVQVEAAGFERFVQENVSLDVDQVVTVDVSLTVGAASQTVTVTGAPPQVDTADAELPRSLACHWSIAMHTPKSRSHRA
jgi:hypothetical protein